MRWGPSAVILNLMKTTKETVQVSATVRVREGGMDGEWVVWTIVDDRPRQYGVYDSRAQALEVATYVAGRAA